MHKIIIRLIFLIPILIILAGAQDQSVTAQGVVIAIQKGKGEVRMLDPHSMGDLVEVWMVRVDHWSLSKKPRVILVEYTHHDSLISDKELDLNRWNFEIHPTPASDPGTCLSWWSKKPSFQSTAQWSGHRLPVSKSLPCYLMQKRPVAIGP